MLVLSQLNARNIRTFDGNKVKDMRFKQVNLTSASRKAGKINANHFDLRSFIIFVVLNRGNTEKTWFSRTYFIYLTYTLLHL